LLRRGKVVTSPSGVKSFWQWLLDKYGEEEAARRYKIWKEASQDMQIKKEWREAVSNASEDARNKVYTLLDTFLSKGGEKQT
jgi:hypothetical protein